jgi:dihydrofolate reductase
MGARTYAQSLLHPDRMLLGVRNHVLSETPLEAFPGLEVEFHKGGLSALVEKIRAETDGDIFVVGGGQVVSAFLNSGLVEELLYFIAPVLLGRGIPLFSGLDGKTALTLVDTIRFSTGIVKLHYLPTVSRP